MQSNDIKLLKQLDGTFTSLNTGLFNASGDYYFCWKPPYINYEGYVKASDSFWKVIDVPVIKYPSSAIFNFNERMETFYLDKGVSEDFQFSLFEDTSN